MNQSSSALMFMRASTAGANLEPLYAALVRSPSSVGESDVNSDFEFDFSEVQSDEPPVSPKLLNFSANWESAALSMVSTSHSSAEHIYMAAPNTHYLHVVEVPQQQHIDDNGAVGADTMRSLHKYFGDGDSDANEQKQKVRLNLRSLMLERRELEQLPPIVSDHQIKSGFTCRNRNEDEAILRSSPSGGSSSDGASSVSDSPSVSFESPSSASSPQGRKNKSNRSMWSNLKLDFLHTKKPSKAPVDTPHHVLRITSNHTPAVMHDQLSDSTENYHDAAEFSHHNCNAKGAHSPARQSTGSSCRSSMSSSGSALEKREKDMKGSVRKSKCASAPVSPAASPSRAFSPATAKGPAGAGNAHWTAAQGVKRPMSPHAQHYEQQRARAEELRRRTLLPYRQSLFGACFSLSTRPQAVAY